MRATVALVEAHPETIEQDYRRVLHLAGLMSEVGGECPSLIIGTAPGGFRPGWSVTPWQLDAVLGWLGDRAVGARVCAVGADGAGPVPSVRLWQDCLTRHQAVAAGPDFLQLHTHASSMLHPALDSILPTGVRVPVGLAKGPVVALTAPALSPAWGVAATGALLCSAITAGAAGAGRRMSLKRRTPSAEIAAEAIGVARELMPQLGVVVDGTLWGVDAGRSKGRCVARNILLAGADPLAVDAVAMRLAGLDPWRVPWLRLSHDRGTGCILPSEVRLVGRTEIRDLDFAWGEGTFTADPAGRRSGLGAGRLRWWPRIRSRPSTAALDGTAWARLADEYAAGGAPLAAPVE